MTVEEKFKEMLKRPDIVAIVFHKGQGILGSPEIIVRLDSMDSDLCITLKIEKAYSEFKRLLNPSLYDKLLRLASSNYSNFKN